MSVFRQPDRGGGWLQGDPLGWPWWGVFQGLRAHLGDAEAYERAQQCRERYSEGDGALRSTLDAAHRMGGNHAVVCTLLELIDP